MRKRNPVRGDALTVGLVFFLVTCIVVFVGVMLFVPYAIEGFLLLTLLFVVVVTILSLAVPPRF